MRGAPRRRFVPSKVSPAEFLVVIDDEPVSFQAHVILLNELVDHARDRFAPCPGHVGQVLLKGKILNNHLSLLEQTDVVSQQQQNVCHASRSIFQRKALDLGVRLSKSHGQLRQQRDCNCREFIEQIKEFPPVDHEQLRLCRRHNSCRPGKPVKQRHFSKKLPRTKDRENDLASILVRPHTLHFPGENDKQGSTHLLFENDDVAFFVDRKSTRLNSSHS